MFLILFKFHTDKFNALSHSYSVCYQIQCTQHDQVGINKHAQYSLYGNDTSDLSKHLQSVGVHDSNTSEGGALLEGLDEKRLGWLELNFSILVLRKFWGVVDLLSTGLLAHLPKDLGHLERNLGGTAENNGCVSGLEDTRVLLNGNHGSEGLDGLEVSVLLDVDDVSGGNLLILGNTLDGKTNGVSGSSLVKSLLVLFDGEDLFVPEARGDNSNNISGEKSSLLNSSADDLSNSLNVVDVGDGKTDGKLRVTLRGLDEVVEGLNDSETGDLLLGGDVGSPSLVPRSLIGLVNKVVSVESRVRNEGDLLGLEADHLKHLLELFLDLIETALVPSAGVHLVDANNDLLNSEKVEKTGMLTGLSLLNSGLGISLGDGGLETSLFGGHKKKTNISGGGSGDHVLDVILVAGSIDNGVVVLLGEELLGVTLDGNTTLALLLTGVKVVCESERGLSLLGGGFVELVHLTLGDSSLLEDEMSTGGGLTGIDVSADNN